MGNVTAKRQSQVRRKLDAELDRALVGTFPASDPFSVGQTTATEPPARPIDRKAPLTLVDRETPVARRRRS